MRECTTENSHKKNIVFSDAGDNADLIIEYLSELKVEYIFGVPGGAIEPLFNAIARRTDDNAPKIIVARHETGAAFMAEGYARETGRLGVCCATTGPGTTNLITGVSSAFSDKIPLLVITAQTPLSKFGRNALQESSCTGIDTVSLLKHCTRYSTMISHGEQMQTKLISAIMAMNRTPKGPVHLSIPSDILRQPVANKKEVNINLLTKRHAMTDSSSVEMLGDILSNVKKVALFLGKDCGSAIKEILEFAEITNSAIITDPSGKRWIDAEHPNFRGVFGFAGHQSALEIMEDDTLDLLIAVGTPVCELSTSGWCSSLLNERLVHIDSIAEHFTRTTMAKHHVCGDLKRVFKHLNNITRPKVTRAPNGGVAIAGKGVALISPEKCVLDSIPLKPQRVVAELSRNIPMNFRLHIDAGNAWAWFTHYFHRRDTHGHYHIAMGLGSMGWAIGASIGTCFGSQQPSVCITGDGSYLMSAQEITVALQHKKPVIFVVLNDQELGMVKHGQKLGGAEEIGFELPKINFAKMAQAMGVEGITVSTPQELVQIDWQALGDKQGPTLIDLHIDPNEIPPMGQRVKGLANKNESATPGG